MAIAQRFMRLSEILGDPSTVPPLVPIVPVCRSAWLAGVKSGIYPKPIKLSPRVVVWRASDIAELLNSTSAVATSAVSTSGGFSPGAGQ